MAYSLHRHLWEKVLFTCLKPRKHSPAAYIPSGPNINWAIVLALTPVNPLAVLSSRIFPCLLFLFSSPSRCWLLRSIVGRRWFADAAVSGGVDYPEDRGHDPICSDPLRPKSSPEVILYVRGTLPMVVNRRPHASEQRNADECTGEVARARTGAQRHEDRAHIKG